MTMRKTVQKKIGERTLTLKELTVQEIRQLMDTAARLDDEEEAGKKKTAGKKKGAGRLIELPDLLQQIVALGCADGLKVEDLDGWTPSALALLWEGFREANSAFFDNVERLGVAGLLRDAIKKRLNGLSVTLLSEATPTPPATATDSLKPASTRACAKKRITGPDE